MKYIIEAEIEEHDDEALAVIERTLIDHDIRFTVAKLPAAAAPHIIIACRRCGKVLSPGWHCDHCHPSPN